jgi:hypothetical protein
MKGFAAKGAGMATGMYTCMYICGGHVHVNMGDICIYAYVLWIYVLIHMYGGYMYVYICVSMYAYSCVCIYALWRGSRLRGGDGHRYIFKYIYVGGYMCICGDKCICMYVSLHVSMYICFMKGFAAKWGDGHRYFSYTKTHYDLCGFYFSLIRSGLH